MESKELARSCAKAISDKKGSDIVIINVSEQTIVCSYFVIASGKSTTQVHALCDNVEEKIKKDFGLSPVRTEGVREGRWGVIDYGDVVVHIFNEESRLFYYLERLWDSGRNVERFEE
ncbi:MAG: ribosome silencing factor [Clostridiales bacterium]|nr:ribosome silencing factor [Clostridiales bacterium]